MEEVEAEVHFRLHSFHAFLLFLPWLSYPSSSSLPAPARTASDCADSPMRLKWNIS